MKPRREKQPPINIGDEIHIAQGGGAGRWEVRAARYAKPEGDDIALVLARGGTYFKTIFNATTMRHIDKTPPHILSRDIHVRKPIRVKPRG